MVHCDAETSPVAALDVPAGQFCGGFVLPKNCEPQYDIWLLNGQKVPTGQGVQEAPEKHVPGVQVVHMLGAVAPGPSVYICLAQLVQLDEPALVL